MTKIIDKPPLDTGNVMYEIKDGILFIERLERSKYDQNQIRGHVERRLEYTGGNSYPCIIFGKELLSLDQGARKFLAADGAQKILSRAFVVEKKQGRLALDFFLGTNESVVPAMIFEDLQEAVEWSKQFRQQ